MRAARIRLIVASLALAGWLGFLGYLALGHPKPVVVSHSQLLAASNVVKAELGPVTQGPAKVRVIESFAGQPTPDGAMVVTNLDQVRLPSGKPLTEAGTYLLPLERTGFEKFKVVGGSLSGEARVLLVYPWNADIERQVRDRFAARP